MTDDTKLDLKSLDIRQDQLEKLKQVFPEIVTEVKNEKGKIEEKIDYKRLKEVLGEEVEEGQERYGMTWPGKADCMKIIQTPSTGTLKPVRSESEDFDNTQNLFIEGDNLEVLKLLQKSYYGKVKMIYIDPPYNTGNDFIYPDDYSETLQTYLEYTGQVDSEGKRFSTNTEEGGRFHSKWVNMMYPRLFLVKNLLREDGVIFISIDDNELTNLMAIGDEIYGETNRIAVITRKTKLTSNKGVHFSPSHEYLVCYAKNIEKLPQFTDKYAQQTDEYISLFKYEDNVGKYNIVSLYMPALKGNRPSRYYIECPDGTKVIPPGDRFWRWSEETFSKNLEDNRVVFKETNTSPLKDEQGNQAKWNIYTKLYLHERQEDGLRPTTFITKWPNSTASKELIKLGIPFSYAKPWQLLKYLMSISGVSNKDIVLDYFAGSGSIVQAGYMYGIEDDINVSTIAIQLPEIIEKGTEEYEAGFKSIADIGKERIRRVIKKIKDEQGQNKQQSLLDTSKDGAEKKPLDLGFKVYKLTKSNFKQWDGNVGQEKVAEQLEIHVDHIDENSGDEDILYEILLKTGFELTVSIETLELAGKKVYSVADKTLLVCLEKELDRGVIDEMVSIVPERVVCLDAGFAGKDQLKTNSVQQMKSKNIEFRTV